MSQQPHIQNHEMMSYPEYFQATILKMNTHELRHNLPGITFQIGDTINLREFNPTVKSYTGRTAQLVITYISPSPTPWLVSGFTLMSTRLVDPTKWYKPTTWMN